MKRLTALLVVVLVAIPVTVQAQGYDGFEAQVSFFERIDGAWGPGLSVQFINFIDNKGLGLFLGKGEALGPAIQWRVFEHWFGDFEVQFHLSGSSDLWQGQAEERLENVTYQVVPRVTWSALDGKMALGVPIQADFVEGSEQVWTVGIQLIFTPGQGTPKAGP